MTDTDKGLCSNRLSFAGRQADKGTNEGVRLNDVVEDGKILCKRRSLIIFGFFPVCPSLEPVIFIALITKSYRRGIRMIGLYIDLTEASDLIPILRGVSGFGKLPS